MFEPVTRRRFLKSAAAAAATGGMAARPSSGWTHQPESPDPGEPADRRPDTGPVVIASGNGLAATAKATEMIRAGKDPLDAVIAGVNIVEEDPTDHSVGYGGLPNEDGVVELDSCVMHGPTHKAGAVASLRNIKTPSSVARLVMERTDHVLLVGQGALRFARAHGFEEVNLLTDDARRMWLRWKEARPDNDWISPEEPDASAPDSHQSAHKSSSGSPSPRIEIRGLLDPALSPGDVEFTYGTINCCALDRVGNLAGVTTTSGLSYKLPGRVGDSPIIGAGLYVDNAIGAAGATGRGEAVILNCGSFAVVDLMRQGRTPTDACLAVLRRIAARNHDPRLQLDDGRPNFNVKMYAVRKDGLYGSASIWSDGQFAVASGTTNRLEDCAYLFEHPDPDD